jgi:large repetitive protein
VITSTPATPTNQTSASFGFTDTATGLSFLCQLDGSAFTACSNPATYPGLSEGSHTFSIKAQDTAGNQSGTSSFTWTIDTTAPPTPAITSTPANPTSQTTASFSFNDTEAGVSFLCQLDANGFSACSSPRTYSGLSQGSHTFFVTAQDAAGNQSGASSFTWTINGTAPPPPVITSTPTNPTNQTSASFSFTDSQSGVNFLCQLDGSAFSACSSPATYSALSQGSHTFSAKAQDAAGNQSSATTYTWTIDTTAPPAPAITLAPSNPTNQTSASFSFTDSQSGVSFLCQLDSSAFSACSSPKSYTGLSQGSHTFFVTAQDAAGNQSGIASFTWTIDTTGPPKPLITSAPTNPTNQTSASFSLIDTEAGVTFLCQLDGSSFNLCSSPVLYPGPLSQGKHTFVVRARDAAGNLSGNTNFSWTVDTTPAPTPVITSTPANPTTQTSATFRFSDAQKGVSFLCQLDGSGFSACSSPKTYSGLIQGSHTFSVKAQDVAGNQSAAASYSWTII